MYLDSQVEVNSLQKRKDQGTHSILYACPIHCMGALCYYGGLNHRYEIRKKNLHLFSSLERMDLKMLTLQVALVFPFILGVPYLMIPRKT